MKGRYERILVLGNGGAGKSTFARELGERWQLPVVHLDKLWWLPGWAERSEEEFDALLEGELARPRWVMDGNYGRTLARRLQCCDCAVLLDIPAEECLRSIGARLERYRGRTRPDMTEGCEERIDEEFISWVKGFRENVLGKVTALLEESGKEYFLFSSRAQARAWMEEK